MVNDYPTAAEEARATLAFRQQKQQEDAAAEEQAKQAVGQADKSNREGEVQALKDISVFMMDLLTVTGDIKAVSDFLEGDKNWKTALSAGLGVVGIKGAAGKVDALESAIKAAPIVKFRKDASKIEQSLPKVPEGHTRLWRGNRKGGTDSGNPSYTADLPGIALPFQKMYGGDITYVDVPNDALKALPPRAAATDAEYILPKELLGNVQKVPSSTDPALESVIKEQASDQKAWAKMGGEKPPTGVKEAYKEHGKVDIDKYPKKTSSLKEGELQGVKPEPWREPNTAQFPAGVDKTRMYNDEFEQLDVGPKHTQAQADPAATSGLSPQRPASEGSRMENAVVFANRRAKQWNSGWDARAMREQVETVHKSGTKEAAKGKAGGKPEFWIYDESADELIKVKRNAKTDELEIKRGKPKENEALKETNEAILWDRATDKPVLDAKGKPTFTNVPVYNDKIDMVVPKEGKKELDKMLHDLWNEALDKE